MQDKPGGGFVAAKDGDTAIVEASWQEKAYFLTVRDNTSKARKVGPYVFSTESVLLAFIEGMKEQYRRAGWSVTELSRI